MKNQTIQVEGKPNIEQLKDWFENGDEIIFVEKDTSFNNLDPDSVIHNGKITKLQCFYDDDALLWVENSKFGLYLRHIFSYSYQSLNTTLLLTEDSDAQNKLVIKIENKVFTVDKDVLLDQISYLKNVLDHDQKLIDLTNIFTLAEFEVLIKVITLGNSRTLKDQELYSYLSASKKIADAKFIEDATQRMNTHLQVINKSFLRAVRTNDFKAMTTLLMNKEIDINRPFGKNASNDNDFYITDCPSDTPLTFAVRSNNIALATFLLEHGANTEVLFNHQTPLCEACFRHNIAMAELLIKHKASISHPIQKPSNGSLFNPVPIVDPALAIYLGMREWLLDTQKVTAKKLSKLLIDNGYLVDPDLIAKDLKSRGYEKEIIDFALDYCSQNTYPKFLKTYKIQKNSLTPSKVANALWLYCHNPKEIIKSLSEFSIWSKSKKVNISIEEVEDKLSKYEIK